MRMIAIALAASVVAGVAPVARHQESESVRDTTVVIQTFQFRPAQLVIPVGTRVVWSNGDQIEHTVNAGVPDSATGSFTARLATLGTAFSFTFNRPGSFSYFCTRHPFMRGEIRVTPTGEN